MKNDTTPDDNKLPSPAPAKPAAADLDLNTMEGPEDVLDWLKTNGTPILVGLIIAALAFLGLSLYRNSQKAAAITAQSQLFNSQSAQQFQDIVNKYPNAPAAPLAALSLASQQFEEARDPAGYDLARKSFAEFAAKFPTHPLRAAADLGIAQCDEATLKLGDALKGYEDFTRTQTNHFLYAQAVFGRGRCLEQMRRYDEARAVYEDFITAHPKDPWTQRAETALLYVGKVKRAADKTKPEAPVPQVKVAPATLAPATVAAPAAAK